MRSPEQKFSQANYMSSLKSALCGKDASLWGGGGWGGVEFMMDYHLSLDLQIIRWFGFISCLSSVQAIFRITDAESRTKLWPHGSSGTTHQ